MEETATISESRKQAHRSGAVMQIRDLYKSFGNNHVLRGFDLDLYPGENVVVLGKSGSGKSVLIKCIIGLLRPDQGSIRVFDQDIPSLSQVELDKIRVKVGFLFQSNALYDSMTVRQNLEFPLRRHRLDLTRGDVGHLVSEVLDNVGLAHTINMMPAELSGGMRKRIALARTLILKPEIILYDEPTTGLDPITGKEIVELMLELQRKYNTSSVVISHDMNCVKRVADRIVVLINGIAYAEGTYATLEQSPDPEVKSFFE